MAFALEVKNLHVSYDGKEVLRGISLSAPPGRLTGIIGPNGAGKSTFMKAVLGLLNADCGTIRFNGKTLREMRKRMAYVPQRSSVDWDFPINVRDTVLLGSYPALGLIRRPGKTEKEEADKCLVKVGMEDFADRQIGQLSGGQQQRVFLARALLQHAEFLFLDEPFVGVDASSEDVIIGLLKELRDAGKSIFVVHHDLSKGTAYFDDLLLLNGRVVACGPAVEVLRPGPLGQAYGAFGGPVAGEGVNQ
ncbi:metal ABC transporter ATP-binding protein [Edaphobacillus lindanitolerans]|uniref:Iron/zinc/copper transport system ATP-binding protein n=1 Tax=Edaphobacillus lindanitolerans TaxID=550447 RepID=A0A1U7PLN1_9BACI|nr:metal ABC transporter ATP-binding protein [Edaphobacillus lindanitolerans]SIT74856.1 iron/zinc/copper transport system ATP-binding protein [Edaphobacillus lindanitolerans]